MEQSGQRRLQLGKQAVSQGKRLGHEVKNAVQLRNYAEQGWQRNPTLAGEWRTPHIRAHFLLGLGEQLQFCVHSS
jgi:hypothetical protein